MARLSHPVGTNRRWQLNKQLAHVPVETDVTKEVVALEVAVVLCHPVVFSGHEPRRCFPP